MTFRPRAAALLLCALLTGPAGAAAQAEPPEKAPRPVRVDLELGFATLDAIHTINAAPAFLTPGVQLRTRGRLFGFAGVRALVFAAPFASGSGAEWVEDDEGRHGHRRTGGLGGGPWVRAGAGYALTASPRSATVTVAGGSLGVRDPHPWFGASAGVPLRGRMRLEAELGWDRNWVEDRFLEEDPQNPQGPHIIAYTRRTEEWYRTLQIGLRWVR